MHQTNKSTHRVWVHVHVNQWIIIAVESLSGDNTDASLCTYTKLVQPPVTNRWSWVHGTDCQFWSIHVCIPYCVKNWITFNVCTTVKNTLFVHLQMCTELSHYYRHLSYLEQSGLCQWVRFNVLPATRHIIGHEYYEYRQDIVQCLLKNTTFAVTEEKWIKYETHSMAMSLE